MSDIQKTGYIEQDIKKQLALQKKQLDQKAWDEQFDYPFKNSEFKNSGIGRGVRLMDPMMELLKEGNFKGEVNATNGTFTYDLPIDRKKEIKQGTFPENNGIFKFEYPDEKIKK